MLQLLLGGKSPDPTLASCCWGVARPKEPCCIGEVGLIAEIEGVGSYARVPHLVAVLCAVFLISLLFAVLCTLSLAYLLCRSSPRARSLFAVSLISLMCAVCNSSPCSALCPSPRCHLSCYRNYMGQSCPYVPVRRDARPRELFHEGHVGTCLAFPACGGCAPRDVFQAFP